MIGARPNDISSSDSLVIARCGQRTAGRDAPVGPMAPIAGAPFFAMAGVHWLALIMLYVGMALGLVSAALYVRRGVREIRARDARKERPKLSS